MPFSDLPEHLLMPALRKFQAWPVKQKDQQYVALRDPYMLTKETMVVPPNIFAVIQRIDGDTMAEEIAKATKAPPDKFIDLLKKLDSVGLLWGPTATKLENETLQKYRDSGTFPIRSSGPLGETADDCKAQIENWFEQTEDPEFEKPVLGIVAPHLDYDRGWPNYASAYYAWKNRTTPDRVVILGTNHFGEGDGAVLSTIGFSSPIGTCPIDEEVVGKLVDRFGDGVVKDLIDHAAEHSIELHLPWLQYCFGEVPIIAVLIPNPLIEMIDDAEEGNIRTSTDEFISTLKEVLDEVGGTTFVVASADLSHVGQQFGEPRPVDEQRKFDVERHDREMMTKYIGNDTEEFISAMKWHNNSTQWCSIGNMSAAIQLLNPNEIELIDYRQACDDKGIALVSSCAMALL
ncbi:MAG: AmmeMemoRadiSam system protein B [Phycisphaerales bacterium]|nr:AmmeMemoRadiSam system protein B [Planctomycetota bacterium]MBL6997819.1 AmmeMemoRadiSam system protein B [Phycisphaerales bacterium]